MATPSPIQDWTLFSLKRVRLKCISAILWMEADHLPQDLELSSAGGRREGWTHFSAPKYATVHSTLVQRKVKVV